VQKDDINLQSMLMRTSLKDADFFLTVVSIISLEDDIIANGIMKEVFLRAKENDESL